MATNEVASHADYRIRLTLFSVHGLIVDTKVVGMDARQHDDGEPYSNDIRDGVIALRDAKALPGDWSTGCILAEWGDSVEGSKTFPIWEPHVLIPPRKGKLSIFD